jgi:hypothetical protein
MQSSVDSTPVGATKEEEALAYHYTTAKASRRSDHRPTILEEGLNYMIDKVVSNHDSLLANLSHLLPDLQALSTITRSRNYHRRRIGWTGSFGIDENLVWHGHMHAAWRETNARFRGPCGHTLQAAFAAAWVEAMSSLELTFLNEMTHPWPHAS